MKLVVYKNNSVISILEELADVEVDENSVSWIDGKLEGIKHSFVILDDSIEVESVISEEVIGLDQKEQFRKVDLVQENKMLKERLTFAEDALLFLLDRGAI